LKGSGTGAGTPLPDPVPEIVQGPITLQGSLGELGSPIPSPPILSVTAGAVLTVETGTVVLFDHHLVKQNVQSTVGMVGNSLRHGTCLYGVRSALPIDKYRENDPEK
jgi:hypothetical protein